LSENLTVESKETNMSTVAQNQAEGPSMHRESAPESSGAVDPWRGRDEACRKLLAVQNRGSRARLRRRLDAIARAFAHVRFIDRTEAWWTERFLLELEYDDKSARERKVA
jgi:hypothetical protein